MVEQPFHLLEQILAPAKTNRKDVTLYLECDDCEGRQLYVGASRATMYSYLSKWRFYTSYLLQACNFVPLWRSHVRSTHLELSVRYYLQGGWSPPYNAIAFKSDLEQRQPLLAHCPTYIYVWGMVSILPEIANTEEPALCASIGHSSEKWPNYFHSCLLK